MAQWRELQFVEWRLGAASPYEQLEQRQEPAKMESPSDMRDNGDDDADDEPTEDGDTNASEDDDDDDDGKKPFPGAAKPFGSKDAGS